MHELKLGFPKISEREPGISWAYWLKTQGFMWFLGPKSSLKRIFISEKKELIFLRKQNNIT